MRARGMPGLDDAVAAGIGDLDDLDRNAVRRERHELGPHAELEPAGAVRHAGMAGFDRAAGEPDFAAGDLAGQHIHARRADEMADESVPRTLEQLDRRAGLHDLAIVHDHDLIGEGQRLGLVVGHIDHGAADAVMKLLELRSQHPFEMRIDDGERFVEHDDVDVGTHEAAAQRNLLLAVGRQSGGAIAKCSVELEHGGDLAHPLVDLRFAHPAVAQRKGEIVVNRHGVVDDRELEHLGDVALSGVASVTSLPSNRMRPSVGLRSPEIRLSKVVLPQPEGPSSA